MEIGLNDEQNTKAYEDTMKIDIEISTHLNIERRYIQLNGG